MCKLILIIPLVWCMQLTAQTSITVTTSGGPCAGAGTTILNFDGIKNGRNSYVSPVPGLGQSIVEWKNNRWENNIVDSLGVFVSGPFFYNNANTSPNPPCFTFDPNWIGDNGCAATSITNLIGDCSGNSIPTLSQWGLFIVSLSLCIIGIIAIRQGVFTYQ